MVPLFAIIYLMIWMYYKSIRKSIIKWNKVVEVDIKKVKLERKIFFAVDLVLSLFLSGSFASAYWYKILQFIKSTSFNTKDPIFGYRRVFLCF